MTGLNRTDLPTSYKVHLAASSLATQGVYGANNELATEFVISRSTVYAAAETAYGVLEAHFTDAESEATSVIVDERQIERAIGALRVIAPNSIRAIEALLPVVYPGIHVSYGKIQQILVKLEQRAAMFNLEADLSGILLNSYKFAGRYRKRVSWSCEPIT